MNNTWDLITNYLKCWQSLRWNQLDWPFIVCRLEWNECCVSIKTGFVQMKRLSRATRGNQMQNKPEAASDKSLSHNHRLTTGICILKAALHGFGFCCCSAVACQRCMQTCICVLRITCCLFTSSLEIPSSCGWCGSCAVQWWCGWEAVGWHWMSFWWRMTRAEVTPNHFISCPIQHVM